MYIPFVRKVLKWISCALHYNVIFMVSLCCSTDTGLCVLVIEVLPRQHLIQPVLPTLLEIAVLCSDTEYRRVDKKIFYEISEKYLSRVTYLFRLHL